MKTPIPLTRSIACAAIGLLTLQSVSAKVFDGGVDSANLGKGDWIYYISQATNKLGGNVASVTNVPSLMAYYASQNVDFIIVKMGTGSTNFNGGGTSPQFNQALIDEAHKAGVKIFGYTRSYGDDIPGEVAMAHSCYNMGADGFVFDAESEWESGHQGTLGPTNAWAMLSQVKTNFPTKFLGHSPFPYISLHSSFPYKEFGYWCDAVMPQDYWYSFSKPPAQVVSEVDVEWRNWQNGLTGQWTNSIKPIAPIGQADASAIPASEIQAFVDALKNLPNPASYGGYRGVSWWRTDLHTASQWTAIKTNNIGSPMGTVNDIVVDNVMATYTGTWTTGTASTDKYAADYRYKSYSTNAYHAQFRPRPWTAGNYQVYEWHPQGSNRSAAAPHVIKHSSGTTTINVNQQINGGKWNLLGTFNLPENFGGSHVRVRDNFTDTASLVMADAMKFVYVTPSAPTAPSGLAASTVDSTRLRLTWTDNSTTEEWFVIARSTVSGGPYTDVGIAGANATSFVDSLLTQNTTYHYVVRAANAGGSSASSSQASATTSFELIIDNPQATVVGTWSTGTTAADRYGADYRFKSGGTGSAYLQYTPTISTPGDYQIHEWHSQGSNRTTNAPYVITDSTGTTTVRVNQQVNGGKWNLIGTFNFAVGTAGNIKIQDNYADSTQVIMADAVKLVFMGGTPNPPPASPSGLIATAVSSSQINLAWTDNSNNEDSFIVARSTTSGGPYTDIETVAANIISYNNTGLAASTTYYYVVRAVNASGASANCAQASATTQAPPPPTAPSGLTATAVSTSEINLSWIDNSSNESNFVVARSTTAGGPYTDIATLGANTTSYSNTGVAANTTYYYVVRATNAGGSSSNSNEASATTQQVSPPAAPSGLIAAAISQTEIDLSWTDSSSNEDDFVIGRSTTSGGPYTDIATVAENTTAYANTGLSAGTTYYYVVRASNAGGSSANSAQAGATTLPNAPVAPSGLTATAASSSQINLSWTDNSSNESNFIVARSTTSGGPYTDIATLAANTVSYSNTGLSDGTTYYYVVRASNAGGQSGNSNQGSATTLPNSPAAPSALTATAVNSSQVDLNWTDNSSNESNFVVARSTTSGGPYTDIANLGANVTSYSNTGLTAGTTYYYVVRATNAGGSSANSNQASATPAAAPTAPTDLTATAVRATQINLSWTDNSSNESNFVVARSTTSGGPYTDVATLGANVTTYNNTGLTANTTYYYVVRATNAGGSSANSTEAAATTFETDLLIDNKSAIFVGAWTTASASTDKYGSDYQFASQGTGSSYAQFTPYIATAGTYEVYEWHPQGANRSTNAPHVITYNGGSATVGVNQEINGGMWNLLGSFNFSTGTTGNIRITDACPDASQVVMADAIKLVFAPPPAAPSGLTATAVNAVRIDLAWTDNSGNETEFVVARSTTSGGPYTDIATVGANATSYSNTGLTPNTTYYYVVRAVNGSGASANSPQASATTYKRVHVNSITMTWVASGTRYKSRATVNVKDSTGANVNSATVTGNFTGAFVNTGLTASTGTAGTGNAVITSTSTLKTGTITFTVTGITGTILVYNSAANVVSSATHSR